MAIMYLASYIEKQQPEGRMRCQMNKSALRENPNRHSEGFEIIMKVVDWAEAVSFWCQSPLVSLP